MADEPRSGLEFAANQKFDLILLDINLPEINGFEVLKLLRGTDTNGQTPVLGVSGHTAPADIENALSAGFNGYIEKPMNIDILLQMVGKFIPEDNKR